jgi:hypothetical protein
VRRRACAFRETRARAGCPHLELDHQEPVEAFAAKHTDETLRDLVRLGAEPASGRSGSPRSTDLVEQRGGELRVAVADQEADRRGAPIVNAPMMFLACCVVHAPVGFRSSPR